MTQAQMTTQDVLASLKSGVEECEACANGPCASDTVLAWNNFLGVKFVNGKAQAVGIIYATAIDPRTVKTLPTVSNGKRERAIPMKRGDVAKAQANELRRILNEGFPTLA